MAQLHRSPSRVRVQQIRAAEYVRMSTEHQRFSIDNQRAAIATYATSHNIEIVRTYADAGRSGLNIRGRPGLQALIKDIESGAAEFSRVLVYDVSRWGRFQNNDESAYYEYTCTRAGIDVEYCAENFRNDGTISSAITKAIRRAMAAEYSRDLSVKVFVAKNRLAKMGFRQGGSAGFGLRRQVIDRNGTAKGLLSFGECKSIATDRVILVPGPSAERRVVRWIFWAFVNGRFDEAKIAGKLNHRGIRNDRGRPWHRRTVFEVLTNEKYIGNNVTNRTSSQLKTQLRRVDPEHWIRAECCYVPIVTKSIFASAQAIIVKRRQRRTTDEELLNRLAQLYAKRGHLSAPVINSELGMPSSSTYYLRFGGLTKAYERIGFKPRCDYAFLQFRARFSVRKLETIDQLQTLIHAHGGVCSYSRESRIMTINKDISLCILGARCLQSSSGNRWYVYLQYAPVTDLALVVRMAPGNEEVRDYFLLPRAEGFHERILLRERNNFPLRTYRLDSIDAVAQSVLRHGAMS